MRKTILRLLLLVVAVAVMAGCVLIGRGYQMYQAALTQQSLESKVAEIQSDSMESPPLMMGVRNWSM